jgi:hypothetical protein
MKRDTGKPSGERRSAAGGPKPAGRTRHSRRAEQGRKRGPARPCAPQSAQPDERPAEKKADVRHPGAAPSQASAGTLGVVVAPSKRKTRKAGNLDRTGAMALAKRLEKYWHGGQHACRMSTFID